jgi:hypothetical protein
LISGEPLAGADGRCGFTPVPKVLPIRVAVAAGVARPFWLGERRLNESSLAA